MIRINQTWWIRLAETLNDVASLQPGTPFQDAYTLLKQALPMIIGNYTENALMRLVVSQPMGFEIFKAAHPLTETPNRTEPLTIEEVAQLRKAVNDYRPVLYAEVQALDAYYVKQQGAYATKNLIENAESALALTPDLMSLVTSELKADLREAGRCLVFQLPTAAGFHVARATETVIRMLMEAAHCATVKESQRNWGSYIKALQDGNVDERITHHLAQIKDLHRNPMIHPDVTLTVPEALALWSVCISVIGTMLADIAAKQNAEQAPAFSTESS